MSQAVLITGADGYLGSRLIRAFIEKTDGPVIAWVRAKGADELSAKRERLASLVGIPLPDSRFRLAGGDLRSDAPFSEVPKDDVGLILHSASVTRFNVEEDLAREVNTEGAAKLFRYATTCPSLTKLIYLSTAYVSGLRRGDIPETALDGSEGFANHYERSKWMAEGALRSNFSELPWVIARIATVIADGDDGRVSQYNAVHNTLKLIYYGLISLVPGKADTPLYFVTGDFVTKSLFDIATRGVALHETYHLVHKPEETLTVGRLLDLVMEVFEKDPSFLNRRVLKPLLVDEDSFEILAGQLKSFSGGVVQQAMGSIEPFAKQLFIPKAFRNERAVAALSSYRTPDPEELVRRTTATLVATKWGRV